MNKLYLDTNVLLDFILKRPGKNFSRAKEVFKQIEAGKIRIYLSILIIDEAIWTIERTYKVSRDQYFQGFVDLISQKGIRIIEIKKKDLFAIFKILWQKNVSFPDTYLFYLSQSQGPLKSINREK